MGREEIFEKLNEIFRDIFDDESITVSEETTAADVEKTYSLADELSSLTGLPVYMTCVKDSLAGEISGENIFPLKLQAKYYL